VAIVRIEMIYPVPIKQIEAVMARYPKAEKRIWAQDEPQNQGAWPYLCNKLAHLQMTGITRPESASPAVGLMEHHKKRLRAIIDAVFEHNAECK
jgi:2-oxoglutarate dehydrogenase E1 component